MDATTHDQKVCSTCGIAKPITEYRRRAKDSTERFGQCRRCHNAAERTRRHKKTAEANRRQMGRYMTQLKNQDSDADVRRVCQAMLAHFGGLKGFVEAWVSYYEEARRERSPNAIKCLQAIVRLVQADPGSRTTATRPCKAELRHRYSELVKRLLVEEPKLVKIAAWEAGWRLTQGREKAR